MHRAQAQAGRAKVERRRELQKAAVGARGLGRGPAVVREQQRKKRGAEKKRRTRSWPRLSTRPAAVGCRARSTYSADVPHPVTVRSQRVACVWARARYDRGLVHLSVQWGLSLEGAGGGCGVPFKPSSRRTRGIAYCYAHARRRPERMATRGRESIRRGEGVYFRPARRDGQEGVVFATRRRRGNSSPSRSRRHRRWLVW